MKKIVLCITCFIALNLISCANKSYVRYDEIGKLASTQNYKATIQKVKEKKNKLYGSKNQLLYNMDLGVLYHYDKNYDSSNIFLNRSVKIFDDLYAHSVTNEALSVLLNDNVRPYRSRPYEVTLLHQFLAFNYLAKGNADGALVEAKQTQLLFDEWGRKGKGVYSNDGMMHYITSLSYEMAGEEDNSLISLYKSIKAFKENKIPLPPRINHEAYQKFKANDREQDIQELGLTSGTNSLPSKSSEIILIGYAGRGPILEESVWWGTYIRGISLIVYHVSPSGDTLLVHAPAPLLPPKEYEKARKGKKTKIGTTFHVKFSMPALKKIPSQTKYFTIDHPDYPTPIKTEVINDLEKMLEKSLEDSKTSTLFRTVIRVVLRTISSQKVKNELAGSDPLANLLLSLGTDVLFDQLEKADTRSCFLIPKTIQIARIPVEAGSHSFELNVHDKRGSVIGTQKFSNIKVKAGEKKVLFYSSLK